MNGPDDPEKAVSPSPKPPDIRFRAYMFRQSFFSAQGVNFLSPKQACSRNAKRKIDL